MASHRRTKIRDRGNSRPRNIHRRQPIASSPDAFGSNRRYPKRSPLVTSPMVRQTTSTPKQFRTPPRAKRRLVARFPSATPLRESRHHRPTFSGPTNQQQLHLAQRETPLQDHAHHCNPRRTNLPHPANLASILVWHPPTGIAISCVAPVCNRCKKE